MRGRSLSTSFIPLKDSKSEHTKTMSSISLPKSLSNVELNFDYLSIIDGHSQLFDLKKSSEKRNFITFDPNFNWKSQKQAKKSGSHQSIFGSLIEGFYQEIAPKFAKNKLKSYSNDLKYFEINTSTNSDTIAEKEPFSSNTKFTEKVSERYQTFSIDDYQDYDCETSSDYTNSIDELEDYDLALNLDEDYKTFTATMEPITTNQENSQPTIQNSVNLDATPVGDIPNTSKEPTDSLFQFGVYGEPFNISNIDKIPSVQGKFNQQNFLPPRNIQTRRRSERSSSSRSTQRITPPRCWKPFHLTSNELQVQQRTFVHQSRPTSRKTFIPSKPDHFKTAVIPIDVTYLGPGTSWGLIRSLPFWMRPSRLDYFNDSD